MSNCARDSLGILLLGTSSIAKMSQPDATGGDYFNWRQGNNKSFNMAYSVWSCYNILPYPQTAQLSRWDMGKSIQMNFRPPYFFNLKSAVIMLIFLLHFLISFHLQPYTFDRPKWTAMKHDIPWALTYVTSTPEFSMRFKTFGLSDMECFSWVQIMIFVLFILLLCFM